MEWCGVSMRFNSFEIGRRKDNHEGTHDAHPFHTSRDDDSIAARDSRPLFPIAHSERFHFSSRGDEEEEEEEKVGPHLSSDSPVNGGKRRRCKVKEGIQLTDKVAGR